MTHYAYRQLTPEQRAEVLRQRQARGYPFHAPPHPFCEAGYYAITAANYEHKSILASTPRCTTFESMLLESLYKIDAEVVGWVILPNHYHLLIGIQSLKVLNYIHYNPVKHQFVSDPYEWPWTSLHNYFEDKGREWLRQKWREFPLEKGIASEFQE